MIRKIHTFLIALMLLPSWGVLAQDDCVTVLEWNVMLSASQSNTITLPDLDGDVFLIEFTFQFTPSGGAWPGDMIFTLEGPDGCISGGGYNIQPDWWCDNFDFPTNWNTTGAGTYTYSYYVPSGTAEGAGDWSFTVINGWTSAGPTMYDVTVVVHGICDHSGCTDPWACNYDPEAEEDDGSCEYPEFCYDCEGNVTVDVDQDGVCDYFEIPGCDDIYACNFDPEATDPLEGACTYALPDEDCDGNSLLPSFMNAPASVTVSCNTVPNPPVVYAQISPYASVFEANHNPNGNCYAASWSVQLDVTETIIEGDCPGNYVIERHYLGTDCMGRQCEHTQYVTVEDNAPPVFTSGTSPQEATCDMDIDFENVYTYEACSEPINLEIGDESILPGSCDGNYTRVRYVTATDACGNSTTVEQTITVTDTEPPLWTELLPEQVISSSIQTEDFGFPSAEDLCGNVTLDVQSEIGPGVCPLAIELTRTFIATDDCGNSTEPFVQVINETTDLLANIENVEPATCFYGYDGSVELSVIGGVQPYEVDYSNNNPAALAPGDYEVTITDENLCSTTLEFTINSPPALQLTLESQQPECSDLNSGIIFADAAGGTGELMIDYDGNDPNAVPAGDYVVTVTDENGCSYSEEVTVEPAILPDPYEIEGDTEVMVGDSSSYEYEFNAGSSYEWTFYGADSLVVTNIFAISLLWETGGEGWVCVQETNATGCVGDQVCIEINVGVGIDELNAHSIDAYPNPTPGNLTVTSEYLTGSQEWMLIDMNGSIVSSGQTTPSNGRHSLNFDNESTGSYVLVIGDQAVPIQIEK